MSGIWERKMKTYFMKFDFDHDGVITEKDFELMAIRFADSNHADAEIKEKLVKDYHEWWKNLTASAKDDGEKNLTMSAFIESLRRQIYDPEAFKKLTYNIIRTKFNLMDVNQNGYLQKDEFRRYFEAAGTTDLEFVEEAFAAINLNHDRKLSFDEFITGYFEFVFSDDEKNPCNLFLGPLVE